MLIDALNPGSRESEVAIVSCFASAILFDISALSNKQFISVCYIFWPIECEYGDGIEEVAMDYDQFDGNILILFNCCAMT
jgi:hypothetical protein